MTNFYVDVNDGQWHSLQTCVPKVNVDMRTILDTSVVIPTVDTLRNQRVMEAFLNSRLPVILCGPPGSGKTMTLSNCLKTMPHFDVVSVNFSSSTQPSLILKIFEQYGCYQKTPNGLVLRPASPDKTLIVFCDEVNLPEEDQVRNAARHQLPPSDCRTGRILEPSRPPVGPDAEHPVRGCLQPADGPRTCAAVVALLVARASALRGLPRDAVADPDLFHLQ